MQKQIDDYKLSPKNELILQDRLHQIDELQKNITETRQVFSQYIEHGNEMCQNVVRLVKNFESIIGFDKSISPMIEILSKFSTVMSDHYKYVQDSIVDKLDQFSNTDIKTAEEYGKNANKEYSSYSKLLESYAQMPTKKRSQNPEFTDLQTKLIAQNWTAIKSNFTFSKNLGLIERKQILEMTQNFILFANHLATTFNQCAQIYEESKDNFNIIMQAIPSTADELAKYKDQMSRSELTLQKLFLMYFKSFDESTVYTQTDELRYEGFIWQKKPKFKKWEKRYCILKYGLLSIFKDNINPSKTFNLLCSSVKKIEDNERPCCFQVTFTEEKFIFQALTSYERDKWINVIQNNIEWIVSSQSPTKTQPSSIPSQPFPRENDNLVRTKSSIMSISVQPKNCICADCGAKSPTWVCINWTTVICIQCSGVHRHLTTLVSKVRSTTLDDIDDTTLELFQIIGNTHANSILEEGLNDQKPALTDDTQNSNDTQNLNAPSENSNDTQKLNEASENNNVQNLIKNFNQSLNSRSNSLINDGQNLTSPTEIQNSESQVKIEKIGPDASKEKRMEFITQKYKNLAFVKKVPIDIEKAIRANDILLVFRSICTGQIHQTQSALHLAAFCGNPLMCRLLALNVTDINAEIGGWNALSYAAFYGQPKAAQILLMSGCSPGTSRQEAHPYRIAMLKQDDEMAALFYPYWNKSQISGQLEDPPLKFD